MSEKIYHIITTKYDGSFHSLSPAMTERDARYEFDQILGTLEKGVIAEVRVTLDIAEEFPEEMGVVLKYNKKVRA